MMRSLAATRLLIVNADDFGLSPGVTRGIIHAHEQGIVTSTSLMVRAPAATEAAAYARATRRLSVGLHLDLGEWTLQDGQWLPRYEVVPLNNAAQIAEEISRQLAVFRDLMGRNPSHIDSHQHVHRENPTRKISRDLAQKLSVPIRHFTPHIQYCGAFYGQDRQGKSCADTVGVQSLIQIIKALKPGITELACHPGHPEGLDNDYGMEREWELNSLCAEEVKSVLVAEDVQLCSFNSLLARRAS